MYTIYTDGKKKQDSFASTLRSEDNSHFLNIYLCQDNESIWYSISKSIDGFYFKSPCEESKSLNVDSFSDISEAYKFIIQHFINLKYTINV